MLAMSSICPSVGLFEYPIQLGEDQAFDYFNLDSLNLPCFSPFQAQDYYCQELDIIDNNIKLCESPQVTSSNDLPDNSMLAKKLNHNASERDRRKKINDMYSSLRALLPVTDQKKKLSIPRTVARVLEYIPELQKEVGDLNRKKEVILSKISALQGNTIGKYAQHEMQKKCVTKESSSCFISANKLCDKEIVLQISTFERISIAEVILLLEKNGYIVIDVSSFQSFGGRTFYNVHLWMEGSYNVNIEKLNEVLLLQLEMHKQMYN